MNKLKLWKNLKSKNKIKSITRWITKKTFEDLKIYTYAFFKAKHETTDSESNSVEQIYKQTRPLKITRKEENHKIYEGKHHGVFEINETEFLSTPKSGFL